MGGRGGGRRWDRGSILDAGNVLASPSLDYQEPVRMKLFSKANADCEETRQNALELDQVYC